MKKFFKIATISLAVFSSIGFSVLLYLCTIKHSVLREDILFGSDAYVFVLGVCFASVFMSAISHALYLREKLYEERKY